MSGHATPKTTCSLDLFDILICYLQFSEHLVCPGADGLTIDDAFGMYQRAVAAGDVPNEKELCRLHPEMAEAIQAYFAEH